MFHLRLSQYLGHMASMDRVLVHHLFPWFYRHDSLRSIVWKSSIHYPSLLTRRDKGQRGSHRVAWFGWMLTTIEVYPHPSSKSHEESNRYPSLGLKVWGWWKCLSKATTSCATICGVAHLSQPFPMLLWALFGDILHQRSSIQTVMTDVIPHTPYFSCLVAQSIGNVTVHFKLLDKLELVFYATYKPLAIFSKMDVAGERRQSYKYWCIGRTSPWRKQRGKTQGPSLHNFFPSTLRTRLYLKEGILMGATKAKDIIGKPRVSRVLKKVQKIIMTWQWENLGSQWESVLLVGMKGKILRREIIIHDIISFLLGQKEIFLWVELGSMGKVCLSLLI